MSNIGSDSLMSISGASEGVRRNEGYYPFLVIGCTGRGQLECGWKCASIRREFLLARCAGESYISPISFFLSLSSVIASLPRLSPLLLAFLRSDYLVGNKTVYRFVRGTLRFSSRRSNIGSSRRRTGAGVVFLHAPSEFVAQDDCNVSDVRRWHIFHLRCKFLAVVLAQCKPIL